MASTFNCMPWGLFNNLIELFESFVEQWTTWYIGILVNSFFDPMCREQKSADSY